ncbi:GMC family oxidoreductase [Pandoraea pnomenusa]|uniref:Alcohol dehydrogenase [acceptor] n=1 Tax=Pandoraea pnomenusa TaxID=93220 RepID=A0A378YRT5_9BURK|nr:GMC family oxidoreductase N-terminal domain-containing protein [Pandoraea pnomenusa]AIU27737.1 GMC family oxidoreductase [Pandoraea pnomenusa]SUA79089.1 Alcohol dehydrogenase [acceptor] [Pandoraea pnomenusa]
MDYDYVIVGGGSAGCALAARLADGAPQCTIALIEAGPPDDSFLVRLPLGLAALVPFRSRRNYGYRTTPQAGLGGRQGYQPRGRGLGGSSSINAMIYTRGHPDDYNDWAQAGCDGWGWSDVLPYFRRSENNERNTHGADAWHGSGGPLNVADLRTINPFSRHYVDAAREAGFPVTDDFNGPQYEGAGIYQVTQKDGQRWNAARAYLHGKSRANLHVITDALVQRIVFDGKRATGVKLQRRGALETIRARAEVVLSAGAFNSPQLLMCSGIGPAAQLRAHGVAVLVDAPGVGENLQDHIDFIINKYVAHRELVGYTPAGLWHLLTQGFEYLRTRRGLFASNVAEAGGFLKSDPALARPDLQMHFLVGVCDNHNRRLHLPRGLSLHACVLRPRSRGRVTLASADMRDAPRIDPAFLQAQEDVDTLLRGVRVIRRILAAPSLARFGGRELHTRGVESDEALTALIRERADTIYHPVGTCRMGSDATSVVDPALRVRGVEGLRVVDASIMPTLIGGNTNAPSIMIGEKAADLMLAHAIGSPQANTAAARASSTPSEGAPALAARIQPQT